MRLHSFTCSARRRGVLRVADNVDPPPSWSSISRHLWPVPTLSAASRTYSGHNECLAIASREFQRPSPSLPASKQKYAAEPQLARARESKEGMT